MKTTNYRLQTEIEHLTPTSQKEWFKNYVREILESDKPYHAKADYIGLSFQELQNKIDYLSADIKELQQLKKTLTEAKTIAQEATATVLAEYGIDRIDGTAISSLTIAPAKTKTKDKLVITDPYALMALGYTKVTVDEDALKAAMSTLEGMNEIDKFVEVSIVTEEVPARIKINAKRNSVNNEATELLVDQEKAA
ncbi:MAG: hypothetical protein U9R27_00560 [Campylobacterota bacterium]|nr:hypothetical protein [Campylobacterota bacterium]